MIFFFRNKKYKKNIKIREDISLLGRSKKCEEFSHYLFIFVFLSFLSPVWCWFSRASRPEKFQTLWIWKNRSPRQHSNVDERDRTKKKKKSKTNIFLFVFLFLLLPPSTISEFTFLHETASLSSKTGWSLIIFGTLSASL